MASMFCEKHKRIECKECDHKRPEPPYVIGLTVVKNQVNKCGTKKKPPTKRG